MTVFRSPLRPVFGKVLRGPFANPTFANTPLAVDDGLGGLELFQVDDGALGLENFIVRASPLEIVEIA